MKIILKFYFKVFICVKVSEKWFYSENITQRSDKINESAHLGAKNGGFKSVQISVVHIRVTLFDFETSFILIQQKTIP